MDRQTCRVELTFIFPASEFSLTVLEPILLDEMMKSNFSTYSDLWQFDGSAFTVLKTDPRFSAVYFHLHFSRRPQYFFGTIFVPMFTLLMLQIAGLMIDPEDSGDRSTYCITIVLAFQFSREQFTKNIPQTSQRVYLVVFVQFTMALAALLAFYILLSGVLVNFKTFRKRRRTKNLKWRPIRIIDVAVACTTILLVIIISIWFYSVIQ